MSLVFGAEIERLQDEKTDRLADDVFADRSLEILSRVEIDVRARAADMAR